MTNIEQFDTAEKIKEAMDALASKYEALISEQRAAGLGEARALVAKFNLSADPGGHSKCSTYGHPNCSTLATVI